MLEFKTVLMVFAGLLGSEIAWRVWKCLQKRGSVVKDSDRNNESVNKGSNASDISEIFIFTEEGKSCRSHGLTRIPCEKINCPVGYVNKLASYLGAASKTLDVCMYIMTCDDLTKAITRAHRQGACVRVIVDSGMSENPACSDQILRMRRAGIEIRSNQLQPSSLMHHKFAIIDNESLLFGSTNWTLQAFYGNLDSIVLTNNKKIVTAFSEEFDKSWRSFSP